MCAGRDSCLHPLCIHPLPSSTPQADYFSTLGLPGWLVQWVRRGRRRSLLQPVHEGRWGAGAALQRRARPCPDALCFRPHPQGHGGNMAVVLLAMGLYGCGCESTPADGCRLGA